MKKIEIFEKALAAENAVFEKAEKKFLEAKTACWDKMIKAQQQSIDDDVYYYRLLDDENLENMFNFSNSPKRQVIRRPYSYVKKPNKKIHF